MRLEIFYLGFICCFITIKVCSGAEEFFQLHSGVTVWARTAFRIRRPSSVENCAQKCVETYQCTSFVYSRITRFCYGRKNTRSNYRRHWRRNRRYDYYERMTEGEMPHITSMESVPNSAGSQISFVRRKPQRPERVSAKQVESRRPALLLNTRPPTPTTRPPTTTTTTRPTTTTQRRIRTIPTRIATTTMTTTSATTTVRRRIVPNTELPPELCDRPIGVQDESVLSSQMSASSAYRGYPAGAARIGGGGWMPVNSDEERYLEIDFGRQRDIVAVATQGGYYFFRSRYITQYKLKFLFHPDGRFETYKENGKEKVFEGNVDGTGVVKQHLATSVRAYKMQFHVLEYYLYPVLKVEVYELC